MSTLFKKKWKEIQKHDPLIDLESLDFLINNYTLRMAETLSYEEWSNLYHQREAVQAQRSALAQTL